MRRNPAFRRRTSLKRIVLSLLALIAVGVAGAGGVALWGVKQVRAPGPLSEPANVVIERGQPTTDIGVMLEREGIVSDHRLFVLTTYLTRASRGDIKAGEYAFPARASMAEVLAIIRSGRVVVHRISVPEGWTSAQVVERVNAHPALTGTLSQSPPEGSLLPDTYVFQRGTSRDALIARMRQARDALLDELWATRAPDLPIKTKEEAIILASIVEKETGVAEERQQVAAVFVNRLRRNMRLQSDPTIIYGITGGKPLDRPITRSDIDAETPYNTYRIERLPPTPIANPGRESLAAVLQPGTSEHLYFVADGSGGHSFATTLNEHNANVRRWRQIEQAAKAETPDDREQPAVLQVTPVETPVQPATPDGEADDLVTAAVAREEPVAAEEPADTQPQGTPEASAPATTLAERTIPLPMPKPQRN